MKRDQPHKVVNVCRWNGRADRFFGKYKDFETNKWVKIPGGVFPDVFNSEDKALAFANEWYAEKKAEHEASKKAHEPKREATWDDICDAYISEVNARMRGKPSTKHEAITVTNSSIRRGVLAVGKPAENDENRCLIWLRKIARENIAAAGRPKRLRKPMTVRNIAKHLRYLFKVVLRLKLIPGLTTNPTQGDEFRDELKAIVAQNEPREWLLPVESFSKLVSTTEITAQRRIAYLTLGLTGLRPGELSGLQFKHVLRDGDVRYLAIEQQWKLSRSKGGANAKAGIDTLKTKWARRNIPIHRSLQSALEVWMTSGWEAWTGRPPTPEDFVFVDEDGQPFRERATRFRRDLVTADCPTSFGGEPLKPYALRHMFSTLLTEAHAHDAAHDRLMGHRPKDTKTLNYSAKLLPFLHAEIESMPFELPTAPDSR